MKKMTKDFRLTNVTRYCDVEEGTLRLTIGNRSKSWKAVWQSNIYYGANGMRPMPRGTLEVRYKNHNQWIDCPRLKMNRRNFIWIEPLAAEDWINLGCDLYLMGDEGWPHPLSKKDYEQMTALLKAYDISSLIVESPNRIKVDNRLNHDLFVTFDWDEVAGTEREK